MSKSQENVKKISSLKFAVKQRRNAINHYKKITIYQDSCWKMNMAGFSANKIFFNTGSSLTWMFGKNVDGSVPKWSQARREWQKQLSGHLCRLFLEKGVLKICSKFTGDHPCQSVISIKLLLAILLKSHFESHFWNGCSPICCIFSERLFLGTPLDGCFYNELQRLLARANTWEVFNHIFLWLF